MFADSDDFYEDDEPLEDVLAAFERGEKGLTSGSRTPHMTTSSSVTIEHCWFEDPS